MSSEFHGSNTHISNPGAKIINSLFKPSTVTQTAQFAHEQYSCGSWPQNELKGLNTLYSKHRIEFDTDQSHLVTASDNIKIGTSTLRYST